MCLPLPIIHSLRCATSTAAADFPRHKVGRRSDFSLPFNNPPPSHHPDTSVLSVWEMREEVLSRKREIFFFPTFRGVFRKAACDGWDLNFGARFSPKMCLFLPCLEESPLLLSTPNWSVFSLYLTVGIGRGGGGRRRRLTFPLFLLFFSLSTQIRMCVLSLPNKKEKRYYRLYTWWKKYRTSGLLLVCAYLR